MAKIDAWINMPIAVFDYDDYKKFVREFVRELPHGGRGQYRRMAAQMRVHTTLISHVFRGNKELTPEQACALASFLGLRDLETDYLLALVERSRAGSQELTTAIDRRLAILRERHQQLEHRLPGARTLSREERATFYSQWYYSAVRLAASLPDMTSAEAIAARLKVPPELVRHALAFLIEAGLLKHEDGKYRLAAKRTHLGASSPLAAAHHRNWRVQSMNRYEAMSARDFAFTAPISLSRADFARVRELLVQAVANVAKIVEPSSCEALAVLNIDWLEF
jgi:uncharacterized protein (TIGR02147 family)